jgi:serine/threonine-protein kinase
MRRPWFAYVALGVGGFALAWFIVAVWIFPVSAAAGDAPVPTVIGLRLADAEQRLEASGFAVQRGESRFNNAPRGTVIEQRPVSGETARRGSRVALTVSSGPRLVAVPAVIGLSREQALTLLAEAGFEAGAVTERPSNEPRGAIIDSRPRPGAQAPTPSRVSLVMSAGPTTVMVPDLVGRALSDATQLLRQVGLAVGEVRVQGGGAPDQSALVQSQTPVAGNQVNAGTRVEITVGRTP